MQIQSQVQAGQVRSTDGPLDLKHGDIVHVKLKDVNKNGEATMLVRGKEVQAKFEGAFTKDIRITVQVTGEKNGVLLVKQIQSANTAGQTADQSKQLLQSLGLTGKEPTELLRAVQHFIDKGIPVSKEDAQQLKAFFENGKGTPAEKLATVEALANKNLQITGKQLSAVHEALHGKKLGEVFRDISRLLDAKPSGHGAADDIKRIAERLTQGLDVKAAVEQLRQMALGSDQQKIRNATEETAKLLQIGKESMARQWLQQSLTAWLTDNDKQLEQLTKEAIQTTKSLNQSSPSVENQSKQETLQQLLKEIQSEPSLNKALEKAEGKLMSFHNDRANELLTSAKQFSDNGRELKARQQLIDAVTTAFTSQPNEAVLTAQPSQPNNQAPSLQKNYQSNEQFQTSVQLSTKDFIVSHVSQKLAESSAQFKDMKREVIRSLDSIQRLIDQFQHAAKPQAKQILESTIKQLNQAILKSDAMLFADMKTEKQLIQTSSQLTQAQKLLDKGEHQNAAKLVQEAKATLEKLNFQPAETMVKRYISKELTLQENRSPQQQLTNQLHEISSRQGVRQEPSAKQMFEVLRTLGLNHESEVGKALSVGQQESQESQQRNAKALLMQMLRAEAGLGKSGQIEQALQNLTGQQLLSKADSGNQQSMMLNIPMQLEEQAENLQVYVKSRNQGEQVDWENCSLYFLIETKKLGEVGIQVSMNDRNLSITIKNDKDQFSEKMAPLTNATKEKLAEIGYNVGNIHFSKMKKDIAQHEKVEAKQPLPSFTEKGMDFKI